MMIESPMGVFINSEMTEKDETGGQSLSKLNDIGVVIDQTKNQNLQPNNEL